MPPGDATGPTARCDQVRRLDPASYPAAVEPSPARRDAEEVLRRALAGQDAEAAGVLRSVLRRGGVNRAYEVAWQLAASTVGDLRQGVWALDFPGIDEAVYEAKWVARFLSAYANGDTDTGSALCRVAAADGHLHACLATLAGSAAATIRRRRPTAAGDG